MSEQQACKTPLLDLLRAVPRGARAWYEHHSTGHSHIPYGMYCQDAASLIQELQAEVAALREALTPSADTKAAYMDEFGFSREIWDEEEEHDVVEIIGVPWTTIKEILHAVSARARGEDAG